MIGKAQLSVSGGKALTLSSPTRIGSSSCSVMKLRGTQSKVAISTLSEQYRDAANNGKAK